MLRALKQLNSEPKVVLTKLKCIENELKKQVMETELVEKSEIKLSEVANNNSPITEAKSNDSLSFKRKASLEEVLSEADAAFFKSNKKPKKDVGSTSVKDKGDPSVEKPRKSKLQKTLLKVKLFKSQDSRSGSNTDLTKKSKHGEEVKRPEDSSRKISQEESVRKESFADTSSLSVSSNTILSYLKLIPKPASDDQTDDELPEFHHENSFLPVYQAEIDVSRSDSVETVALELEDKQGEDVETTFQPKDNNVECLSVISPHSSPAAIESTKLDAQDDSSRSSNDLCPAPSLQLSDEQKGASNALPTASDPACSNRKSSASEPTRIIAAREISVGKCLGVSSESLAELEGVGSTKLLEKSLDVGYLKHSSIIGSSTPIETSSRQLQDDTKLPGADVLHDGDYQPVQVGQSKEPSNTVNIEDVASITSKGAQSGDSLLNQSILEDKSSKEVLLNNVVEALIQDSLPLTSAESGTSSPSQSPKTVADDEVSVQRTRVNTSKANDVTTKFNVAFKIHNALSPLEDSNEETNNNNIPNCNYEEQKRAVMHEMDALKKAYQTLVTIARPHETSLRESIVQYDAIKSQLELKQKEGQSDLAQIENLTTVCDMLQKKYDKVLQEKTNAQQINLETEMRLREQQMELCRERLHLGIDQRLDESHHEFHVMRERQEKVIQLTKEVAEKNAVYKAAEEALALSKLTLEKAQKELKASKNRYNGLKNACEKLTEQLGAIKSTINEKAVVGKQHFEEQRRLWLKGIELRQEFLKIESLERLEDLNKRRRQALVQVYSIDDMLKSRSISLDEGTATESPPPISTISESKSDTGAADEESLPAHATPSTLTLNELAEAVPYYADYLDKSKTSVSSDEKILCRNIIRGCRQYGIWKSTYVSGPFDPNSLDEKTLKQGSAYIKDFVIPLFQLWTMKNTTASSVLNLIINEGFTNDWYGFPSLDPFVMRSMLETNVRDAISIGKKFVGKFGPSTSLSASRIEYSITPSKNSLVPVTSTNEAQASSECAINVSKPIGPNIRLRNTLFEKSPTNNQENHSQVANSSDAQAAQPIQTQPSTHHVPTGTITVPASLAAVCITQPQNQISAPQVWNNAGVSNGIMAIQSTLVQNTALVLPMPTAQFVNANQQFIPITTNTPVAFVNPPAYSTFRAVNAVQYPQHINQNPVGNYSCAQPVMCSPNSQGITNNTQPTTSVRAQYQTQPVAQTVEMQNQRITTTHGPATQHRPPVEPQRHRPPSAQQSRQELEQRRAMIQPLAANCQNKNPVNRTPQQMMTQQRASHDAFGLQSQARQTRFFCAYCRADAHQKCSACHNAYYCSGQCQLAHWDMHRASCVRR